MSTTLEKSKTINKLENTLADSYTLLLKTHNYHWNVTGSNFYGLHNLFEVQYRDLFEAVDEIAERIRTLGSKSPGSFSEFSKISIIDEARQNIDATQMVEDLTSSNEKIAKRFSELAEAASEANDKETEDLAITRAKTHQKNAWMLRSTL
jgi:starvation-inducible DNA-binding protein